MPSSPTGGSQPSTVSRKRPLARRSCLKCREKKARCELPDLYVDSTKTPLPDEKRCHRCNVLNIQCIVWDGDRKRKPRLDRPQSSTWNGSVECNAASTAASYADASSSARLDNIDDIVAGSDLSRTGGSLHEVQGSGQETSLDKAAPNAIGEQLGASDVSQAQRLLLNRQKGWKTMARTLLTLVERLQKERKFCKYLALRIDAPPSTPDIVSFLDPSKLTQLDIELRDHLVGHPYLPSLSTLHQQQSRNATGPRALLLATMTLLALRGVEDPLTSTDSRSLSGYIDRLGTQMLLSAPRDIHLVMAFELLLAHEPGLVGTAASQYQPEARGHGLASENLLTCSLKIARDLKLGEDSTASQNSATSLASLSLWCCLRVWETLYSFVGTSVMALEGLDAQFAARIRGLLQNVDDEGHQLPLPPRLEDPIGPTADSYREMRDFCSEVEKRLGQDGVLRSAGRTVICLRIETACCLFDSLGVLKETLSNSNLTLEEKHDRIVAIHSQASDGMLAVKDCTHEQLGAFAGLRLVRLWEQVVHIECSFLCSLFSSYCTSALFSDRIDGGIEIDQLTRSLRLGIGPAQHIATIGRFNVETSRAVLSGVSQLDRQPILRKTDSSRQSSTRFIHRLPTLLVSAMAVDAAKSCLEGVAFVLVVWADPPQDVSIPLTLMETASQRVLQLAPKSSSKEAITISQVAASFIDEMVDTIKLWQLFYRVYRPASRVRKDESAAQSSHRPGSAAQPNAADTRTDADNTSIDGQRTAMDFLASAAEAAQGAALSGQNQLQGQAFGGGVPPPVVTADQSGLLSAEKASNSRIRVQDPDAGFWNEPSFEDSRIESMGVLTSSLGGHVGSTDADIYSACIPFDLEAFLKDVDQLF